MISILLRDECTCIQRMKKTCDLRKEKDCEIQKDTFFYSPGSGITFEIIDFHLFLTKAPFVLNYI